MENDIVLYNIQLEDHLNGINEEKLPQIFAEQVHFLEKANQEYDNARDKEKQARQKVEDALIEADKLIASAKNMGEHTASKKKFLMFEWTSKKDEIDAIKQNLIEMINHNESSAEAQKKLAEVQSSLMESQTAILQVQKAHIEYQQQIANATKFVLGLSAYNMGVSQSIYENLKEILAGETPEKLGELAQQQLFLALDQIRNLESFNTRVKKNESLIEDLNSDIVATQKEIDEIGELYKKQNLQISENAQDIDKLEQQYKEQNDRISNNLSKILHQDKILVVHEKKAIQHESKIAKNTDKLSEHEQILNAHEDKCKEFKELFAAQEKEDKKQNLQIESNLEKIQQVELRLVEVKNAQEKNDETIKKALHDLSQQVFEELSTLENNNKDMLQETISSLLSAINQEIIALGTQLEESKKQTAIEFSNISNQINDMNKVLSNNISKTNSKFAELTNNITTLDAIINKKAWKIVISIITLTSLILNILQISGVI